jgi:hypothetical protein
MMCILFYYSNQTNHTPEILSKTVHVLFRDVNYRYLHLYFNLRAKKSLGIIFQETIIYANYKKKSISFKKNRKIFCLIERFIRK